MLDRLGYNLNLWIFFWQNIFLLFFQQIYTVYVHFFHIYCFMLYIYIYIYIYIYKCGGRVYLGKSLDIFFGKISFYFREKHKYRNSVKIVIFSSKLLHEFEGFACKNESLSRLLNTQIFFFDFTRPHKMIFVNIALLFAHKII